MVQIAVALITGIFGLMIVMVTQNIATKNRVAETRETLVKSTESTTEKLDQIHVLVNSRLTEALNEIAWLKARLEETEGGESG